jgi:hypothetical protein
LFFNSEEKHQESLPILRDVTIWTNFTQLCHAAFLSDKRTQDWTSHHQGSNIAYRQGNHARQPSQPASQCRTSRSPCYGASLHTIALSLYFRRVQIRRIKVRGKESENVCTGKTSRSQCGDASLHDSTG